MKNQMDYFEKVIKVLRDLKSEHPDVDITKHLMLATDANINFSDKELFHALQQHKSELDMNTLSDKDLQKVIDETEELFTDVDYDETLDGELEEEF
jgi:hypothetical protein